jgi:general secretion pathway protein H
LGLGVIIPLFPISVTLESIFTGRLSGGGAFQPLLPLSLPLFSRKTLDSKKGYTLIELVVVIVLLGLLFGLVLPQLRTSSLRDSLDSTSLRIIGLVRELREKAISDQVSYALTIDIRQRKLWYHAGNATEEEKEAAEKTAKLLPPDVEIEDIWSWSKGKLYDEATILFSRKGYIEQSMIHLQSEDGRQLSLELTPFLGSVKIHDGYVDIGRD